VHWAHRVADRIPDGVIFADLRGTTQAPATPAETMGQVLRGAGVPGDQLPRTDAELEAQCRALLAGRRTLLILDDAADAAQIRPLVAAADAGLVVATTQRRLPAPLPGADVRTLELREMAVQEAVDLIAAVLGGADERIREEDRALARLARECGFLPLALAIMGARLADNPGRSIADTVRELADRDAPAAPSYTPSLPAAMLHETGAHAGGTQGLHTVLSPTFEIAYRALRREQREAFRLLGLVAGPDFTPSALAALLGRPVEEAGACLEALRQAYLVQDVAPGRYRMHDLLRDFARERGLGEDADSDRLAAQRRLLAGYLAEAREAGRQLGRGRRPTLDEGTRPAPGEPGEPGEEAPGAAARTVALSWFEAERRNLVAAVHQAARLGLHRTCWELADALFDFQWIRRYSQGNIDVHQAGLRAARAEEDWRAAAVMLHNLAVAHFELGGSVQAIGYGEEARRGFRSADPPDRFGEAAAQATLADVHASLGRYLTAIQHARRSLAIHESLGDGGGVAKGHETLATAYIGLADYDTALGHAGEALGIRRAIGDMQGVAETLLTLAQVHRRRGAVHEAVSHALEALYLRQDMSDRHGAAQALNELARMNASLGLRDLALRDAEQALRTYQALGARHGEAKALTTLGMLMSDAARFAEAFTYCGEALRLHREIGDRSGEAETLAQTGVAHWRLGRYREAREHLVRALEIHREIGDLHGEAHDLEHLSMVMRRLERDQEAFVLGLEALDLWHRLGAKGGLAGTLGSLARTYLRLRLYEEAEQAASQALAIRREIGDWYGMGVGMDTFAAVLRHGGRPEEALKMELEALRVLGEVGDRHSEGTALVHLAAIYLELDRVGDALETGRQALELATELGDTREQAIAHHTMGGACRKLGRHSGALGHFRAEIDIRREMADHRGQRAALEGLRDACLALGDDAGAADCARRIRAIDNWLESEGPEGEEGGGARP
jgi:tetratricopeptide (TPR) repeat protein